MNPTESSEVGAGQRLIRRVFKQWVAVEPTEFPQTITAFFLFFCALGGYFTVRPVRETFGTILGSDRVSDLYVVTSIASVLIVPAYGLLCARVRRSTFLPWIYGGIALMLASMGAAFSANAENIGLAQFAYVAISVISLFVTSVFFSFLLELFEPEQTKRLFPAIAAGGTLGALAFPILTGLLVGKIGNPGILFVGAGVYVIAILLQFRLLRMWAAANAGAQLRVVDVPMGGNPLKGIWLVVSRPYLFGIAVFVILLATANTILYFEQLRLVAETFPDRADRTRVFSMLDTIVQSLTILSQVAITGHVAKKWGVVPLLTIVPLAMVVGFFALATWYSFAVLAVVFVVRRAGEYAFVRPGREMLFGGVSLEAKYKAKNTIDVAVYRGGDALTAQLQNALGKAGFSPQTVVMMGAGAAAAWAINGWLIGRHREKLELEEVKVAAAVKA